MNPWAGGFIFRNFVIRRAVRSDKGRSNGLMLVVGTLDHNGLIGWTVLVDGSIAFLTRMTAKDIGFISVARLKPSQNVMEVEV